MRPSYPRMGAASLASREFRASAEGGEIGERLDDLERELPPVAVEADPHDVAVAHLAREDLPPERRFDLTLDRALERTRAVRRLVAAAHEVRLRIVGDLQRDPPVAQPFADAVELDLDDLLELVLRQRVEDDDLVDAVEKLRTEALAQLVQHGRAHHRVLAR